MMPIFAHFPIFFFLVKINARNMKCRRYEHLLRSKKYYPVEKNRI